MVRKPSLIKNLADVFGINSSGKTWLISPTLTVFNKIGLNSFYILDPVPISQNKIYLSDKHV